MKVDHDAPTARNIALLEDEEEENVYAREMGRGHKLDPRLNKIVIMAIILVVLYFVGLIIPKDLLNQGLHQTGYNAGYTLSWFVEDLGENINGFIAVLTGHDDPVTPFANTMILYVVVAVSGAGLALCGAVYQGAFKNALVSPSTLGVNNGATLGMMVWVIMFVSDDGTNIAWLDTYTGDAAADPLGYIMSMYSLSIYSFIGCLIVVGVVLLVMQLGGREGSISPIMMIICGQVIGSLVGAFSNEVRYWYIAGDPESAKASLLTDLMIASFYRTYSWIDIVAIAIPLALAIVVVVHYRNRMMILSFSKEEARTLGVDTKRMTYILVAVCTLLTAILVSFVGRVGFVGFLVPHLARRLVGPNFQYLLPAATVLGGLFVLAAYLLVSTTLGADYETMTGMFISIGGAAVFLVTALRGKGGARGEFR